MRHIAACAALLVLCALTGCRSSENTNGATDRPGFSPVIGTWTGKSEVKGGDLEKFANSVEGGPLTGPSSMTLNDGGTGFLKVGKGPERPIAWKQEGDRLILETRGVNGTNDANTGSGGPWVARWSNDDRTWTIDMEKAKVTLNSHSSP